MKELYSEVQKEKPNYEKIYKLLSDLSSSFSKEDPPLEEEMELLKKAVLTVKVKSELLRQKLENN